MLLLVWLLADLVLAVWLLADLLLAVLLVAPTLLADPADFVPPAAEELPPIAGHPELLPEPLPEPLPLAAPAPWDEPLEPLAELLLWLLPLCLAEPEELEGLLESVGDADPDPELPAAELGDDAPPPCSICRSCCNNWELPPPLACWLVPVEPALAMAPTG